MFVLLFTKKKIYIYVGIYNLLKNYLISYMTQLSINT